MAMVIVAAIGVVVIGRLLMRGTGETRTALVSPTLPRRACACGSLRRESAQSIALTLRMPAEEVAHPSSGSCQVVNVTWDREQNQQGDSHIGNR